MALERNAPVESSDMTRPLLRFAKRQRGSQEEL